MTDFDINQFKNIKQIGSRYEKQLARLRENNYDTSFVETAVNEALDNLNQGCKSFVIYGEPQSGKTEMMICLTGKLLDKGNKIIIVLLNDNVELLKQNLQRFKRSGIGPAPKNFTDIIDPTVKIGNNEWIIFCKKNAKDLPKLIEKLNGVSSKVIIDDECDYATPNNMVNRRKKSKINALIDELLRCNGTYIGVTATPARLDLNNTFGNANDRWVNFPPHSNYTGQYVFFPVKLGEKLAYRLNLLPDQGDGPKHLRKALFSFFVNVAYLNYEAGLDENYCMLVHTSGKREDHSGDYKQIVKTLNILKNAEDSKYESYIKKLWEIAEDRFDKDCANEIVHYILRNILRSTVVVMNSDKSKNVDYSDATDPTVPFTIAIGGNIVSRGVTFKNLLSMFFTRDVKHKIQQDTYIQRARMFGSRELYIKYFELSIPEKLFLDWHKCFVFHRLALESINSGNGVPVWLEDRRVRAVSSASIDKSTVAVDSGEMGFEIFDLAPSTDELISDAHNGIRENLDVLKELNKVLGNKVMPNYVIDYVQSFMMDGNQSIAIHKSAQAYSSADQETIERAKGFIGTPQLEIGKFPKAIHHFKIFHNADNKARMFYRYVGNIKFLRSLG
ncbi:DEAD/DEAH box helicase family protein [Candidatus Pacearchaeota archaeon]|nr:DEAD/DEAH box helicase family protein [Candidatus Pacearchaeota archaeon]